MKIQVLILDSSFSKGRKLSTALMRALWKKRDNAGADDSSGLIIKCDSPGNGVERIIIETDSGSYCCNLLENLGLKRVKNVSDTEIFVQKTGDKEWLATALECYSDIKIRPDFEVIAQAIEDSK